MAVDPTQLDTSSGYDPTLYGNTDPSYLAYLYGGQYQPDTSTVDQSQVDPNAYTDTSTVAAPTAPQDVTGDPTTDLSVYTPSDYSSLFPALPSDYYASYYDPNALNPAPDNSIDYSGLYDAASFGGNTVDPASYGTLDPNAVASPAYGSPSSAPPTSLSPSYG